MNKAVIYARVSSKDQEAEGFSIPAQLKLLHEYATKNDFNVVGEYTDVETAKKVGRTQFNKMLNYMAQDQSIKHILVEKTDRITRNLPDYALIDSLITQSDLAVHLVKENETLNKDSRSTQKFIFGIKALMAKNYIDNLSEEVKKGMQEKAAQGTYPSIAPYGYLNAKVDGRKVIVLDPDTAPLIKRMFELYATGSYSLLGLRKKMIFDGMIYKKGKALYTSKIETILKNVFYVGDFVWKGKKYENGSHEPIVSKELFYAVQSILRSPYKSKSRKGLFPYTNLIKCGICGCALTAEIKKEKYIYYRCSGYKGNCRQTYLKQEVLEQKIETILDGIVISEQSQELVMQGLRASMEDKIVHHNTLVLQTERQIKFLQNRIDQATIDKLDRKISEEFYQTYVPKWIEEKERLAVKLLALQKADRHYLENANLILELSRKAVRLFQKQDVSQKRRLIDILVSNCSYTEEKLDLELKPVFKEILKTTKSEAWCARMDSNHRPTD
jgi:site-specific DNA recombinase